MSVKVGGARAFGTRAMWAAGVWAWKRREQFTAGRLRTVLPRSPPLHGNKERSGTLGKWERDVPGKVEGNRRMRAMDCRSEVCDSETWTKNVPEVTRYKKKTH